MLRATLLGTLLLGSCIEGLRDAAAVIGTPLQDGSSIALDAWFSAVGVKKPLLRLADFDGMRGVQAIRDIPRGAVIAEVPVSACILTDDGSFWDAVRGLSSRAKREYSPAHVSAKLATVLLWEFSKGPASHFAPYLAALPPPPRLVSEWSDKELACLQDPALAERAVVSAARYGGMRAGVLTEVEGSIGDDDNWLSASKFHSAMCLVQSRCFRMVLESGPLEAMVPLIDLMNHSPGCCSHMRTGPDGSTLQFVAGEAIKAGEEVYNSYGRCTNADLLLGYGYTTRWPAYNLADTLLLGRGRGSGSGSNFKLAARQEEDNQAAEDLLKDAQGSRALQKERNLLAAGVEEAAAVAAGAATAGADAALPRNEMSATGEKGIAGGAVAEKLLAIDVLLGWDGFQAAAVGQLRLASAAAAGGGGAAAGQTSVSPSAATAAPAAEFDAAERRIVALLLLRCRWCLDAFPTTLEEDLVRLKQEHQREAAESPPGPPPAAHGREGHRKDGIAQLGASESPETEIRTEDELEARRVAALTLALDYRIGRKRLLEDAIQRLERVAATTTLLPAPEGLRAFW